MMLLLTWALAVQTPSHASALPPLLKVAIEDYDRAQVKGDAQMLARLLADDYLLINSGGATEDKTTFVKELTAKGYRLDPFVVRQPVFRVWSGGAVAGGVALLTGVEDGKPFSACLRFADVWRFRSGHWQVVFTQASRALPVACKEK